MKNLKKLSKNDLKKVNGGSCSQWYSVDSGCGRDYYMCGDNYSSPRQMHQAMMELNEIKCG
ncbi:MULTISPECIES: bacteriocin-like protein [unclassified Chryseobacterium]|uniref:bacteriocin-like protein n=1 Tax=unclassified Chryseobacterium TaxID=2593645 RepID=UPI00100C0250|nr:MULTISPECIES: hypothetical protein [unclassified Chryseobacterium]RXM53555.1 hypothetical protein BOQ64_04175 [Chryseobacterium sp. CH25]RXM63550.1 hypothetical protein BOQ60_16510 [Chryseobacterium sp. CH1]